MTISCGQCSGCRLETSRQWTMRLMHEASTHDQNCWITLTYNKEHLPQDRGLHKPDFTKFMKRFRFALVQGVPPAQLEADPARYKVRYYQCGEYGDRDHRPHHHACIFGQDFSFDRTPWKMRKGNQTWRSETLNKLWSCTTCKKPIGYAEIGALTAQSAGYTARYIMKKQNGQGADLHYLDYITGVIRERPYTTMSTNPGIGRKWIDKYHTEVFPLDEVIMNGHRTTPPKYYDAQYQKLDPIGFELVKETRQARALEHSADNTPRRLADKEIVLKARTATLTREL